MIKSTMDTINIRTEIKGTTNTQNKTNMKRARANQRPLPLPKHRSRPRSNLTLQEKTNTKIYTKARKMPKSGLISRI
jgi:hypothetical protein